VDCAEAVVWPPQKVQIVKGKISSFCAASSFYVATTQEAVYCWGLFWYSSEKSNFVRRFALKVKQIFGAPQNPLLFLARFWLQSPSSALFKRVAWRLPNDLKILLLLLHLVKKKTKGSLQRLPEEAFRRILYHFSTDYLLNINFGNGETKKRKREGK